MKLRRHRMLQVVGERYGRSNQTEESNFSISSMLAGPLLGDPVLDSVSCLALLEYLLVSPCLKMSSLPVFKSKKHCLGLCCVTIRLAIILS